jgi:hypothetical protein
MGNIVARSARLRRLTTSTRKGKRTVKPSILYSHPAGTTLIPCAVHASTSIDFQIYQQNRQGIAVGLKARRIESSPQEPSSDMCAQATSDGNKQGEALRSPNARA